MHKVFDLHCDTIDAICMRDDEPYTSMPAVDTNGWDLEHNGLALSQDRCRAAGLAWCQCYAVWVPDAIRRYSPLDYYRRAVAWFKDQARTLEDTVPQVRDAREVDAHLEAGHGCALLSVEGASPVGDDLGVIDEFARDGVRMVTLTWNGKNSIASGNDTTDGISSFGAQAIRALEEQRIVVDVSHLNDRGFADLLGLARRPFVASHSCSRAICDHPRNLTDDQFRAIRDCGGVVGINYFREFVSGRAHDYVAPDPEVSFDELAAHVEHFLDLGGEDVVALGSDYDGAEIPVWLDACEKTADLRDLMVTRFGETVTQKVFYDNARRFFEDNERL